MTARQKKLTQEALAVLGSIDIEERSDGTARAVITAGQLDRKVYVEVNAALEAAEPHRFPVADWIAAV